MTGHRDTIFLEDAEVLAHDRHPGDQYILKVHAPRAAATARPGSFVHIRCSEAFPMRRPLSIMRVHRDDGCIELLYKPVGDGLRALTAAPVGRPLSVLGPIGNGFVLDPRRPNLLAIGGGVGIPPMLFLAETARESGVEALVLMGSEVPFPFELAPALLAQTQTGSMGTEYLGLAVLEAAGIGSLLASNAGLAGCYRGFVPALAQEILSGQDAGSLRQMQLAACGPEPMLHAVAKLAAAFGLPCQLALEEFMACGVGGCAGCVVPVRDSNGEAMKRVCVDGPVFDSREIYPTTRGS